MMHHAQIAQRAFNTPLMVDPAKAMAFLSGLGPRITGQEITFEGLDVEATDQTAASLPARASLFGNDLAQRHQRNGSKPYALVDGIAVIEIAGTLVHRGAWIGQSSGLTSYEGIAAQLQAALADGKAGRTAGLDEEEKALVRDLFLLTLKPVMYIANVLEDGFENNPHLDAVRARAVEEGAEVVPVSAAIEEELSQLEDDDRDTFLADLGLAEPGLNRVIRAAYKLLGLQTYFTAGVKEVRAWTVKAGSTAPQAAAVIHTDFEKGFIRAETIAYDDFLKYRGESGARDAGRLRLEGKEYRVQEGDVLHFRFNV